MKAVLAILAAAIAAHFANLVVGFAPSAVTCAAMTLMCGLVIALNVGRERG